MEKNNKSNHKRISEAQGEKSRQTGSINEIHVLQTLVEKPLTFSELLRNTGFSKPVLAKHLRNLMRNGSIYKDTIKLDEKPEEVGKIVYRHIQGEPKLEELLLIGHIKHYLKMPKPYWSEKSKIKVIQLFREIGKIYSQEEFTHPRR
jgi:DNA-binding HxlR family transcriptional regulator